MIRVLIADDHAIVREGIKQILSEAQDIQIGGEAATGQEVMESIRQHVYDVVLLDIQMPAVSGIEILKMIKQEQPDLAVLILTIYSEDQYAIRTLKAGASGYLTKETAPEQLVEAIRQVAAGRSYVTPSLGEKLARAVREPMEVEPHERLSNREYQVFMMIASGKTISEIGAELNLSVKTISTYRARIIEKTKFRNNAEMMHYVFSHGLNRPSPENQSGGI